MYTYLTTCTSILTLLIFSSILPPSVHSHAGGVHPIHKLIRGTFVNYDDNGDEAVRMYICKARGGKYYGTFIATTDNLENYMLGFATFTTANIDDEANTITDIEGFFQHKGHAKEITPASMDVAKLCDDKQLTVSFTFHDQAMSMDFTKVSVKDELIGNEDLNGYQCGIPWDGDYAQEDVYPFAFESDPFSWSPAQWSEVQVFTAEDEGCWAYALADGSYAGTGFGGFFQRRVYWGGGAWTEQWDDDTLDASDPCSSGSELSIRVDQDVLLTGFQCRDGTGAGFLLYKTGAYSVCPVFSL